MELEYETRPSSMVHNSQWHPSQNGAGPSTASSSSTVNTRRRSTVLNVHPPGPPPSQPIPNVPAIPVLQYSYERPSEAPAMGYQNGTSSQMYQYTRPSASASLAAVAAFSEARFASASSPSSPPSSSTEDLLDSPPRSMLRAAPVKAPDPVPDRVLLRPEDVQPPTASRPSSRRALTKALELAREAVKLDTNDDPYAAVVAYGQSVTLLGEVMERVMKGEAAPESHRKQNGRRRSIVAQEEEVRRLKTIHDTYAERMNTLCEVYSIPVPPHSPGSTYTSSVASSVSASTESTQPPSPISNSPSSNTPSPEFVQPLLSRRREDDSRVSSETVRFDGETDEEMDGAEAIGTAFTSSILNLSSHSAPNSATSPHPYASPTASAVMPNGLPSNRMSAVPIRPLRPRASSTLPPPAPPPTSSPPPAPSSITIEPLPESSSSQTLKAPDVGRMRGSSVSHRRTGSGARLAALHEEVEKPNSISTTSVTFVEASDPFKPRGVALLTAEVGSVRDSHPLPPIPSPSTPGSVITPRNPTAVSASEPSSPHMALQSTTPRPRGGSTFSVRSEMATPTYRQPLINTSPLMGTISQRRGKTSAPPSTDASSPAELTASLAYAPSMSRLAASTLPANTAASLGIASRSRASSQPGRRPSVASNNSYPYPPASAGGPNGAPVPRKVSIPSRFNLQTPNITVNTALLSPPLGPTSLTPLVPPPPIPYHNIPTAPLSPLPSLAPPDPLRKPYHMMTLLRQTMTSKTGGYITRRLHVPQEVWSQGGAKLTNIAEKIRVVEVLCSALEEVQSWSAEYFGAGNVSSGMVMGIGSIGRREGELWSAKLEEFSSVLDSVVGNFGKKLGVGEGFVTKKTSGVGSWGNRLTRQFDKITNGKNLDSPAAYVHGLSKLFVQVQILDEHTKAVSSVPVAPLYAGFPLDVRQALEFKLRHASEFFAKVVLTFVIRDLALLLDKYVKKCEKWLAE